MGRSTRRGPWLPEEDANLLQLVHLQGPNNWVRISQHMQHRSPKQCRERYHQNLKPSLNHEPVSAEEGEIIEQLVQETGKRWAEIARRLGNRSDNAVKNWWNGSMNRRKRSSMQPNHGSRLVGPRPQPISATRMSGPELFYSHQAGVAQHDNPVQLRRASQEPVERSVQDITTRNIGYQSLHHENDNRSVIPPLERSSLLSNPQLPPLDVRHISHSHHTYSAPGSLQVTPSESSPSALHPPHRHYLPRPTSLETRPSYHADWMLPRMHMEASAISPAATDFSTAPSLQQAPPSLISDNQSHYSISPKTVSSPRPGTLAPIDTTHYWSTMYRSSTYLPTPGSGKHINNDEGYMSAMSASCTESNHHLFPIDPSLKRENTLPLSVRSEEPQSRAMSSPTERDTRMNVSSLLK